MHRCSQATSTIGSSLLCRRLLQLTSAVPSLPRPRSLRAWANNGGQIIAPPLPREVYDWVFPPLPVPPPINVRGPVLAAPPLVACVGQQRQSNYYAVAPLQRPRSGRPSSAGASFCRRPQSRPRCAPACHVRLPRVHAPRGPLLPRRRQPGRLHSGSGVHCNGVVGGQYRGTPWMRRQGTRRCQGAALLVPRVRDISLVGGEERPWLADCIGRGLRVAGTHDCNDQVLRSMRRPGPGLGSAGCAGGTPVQWTVLPCK